MPAETAPATDPPARQRLRFSGVRRRFGRLSVLAGVDGEVAGGGALLVTGTNGSGKSTLLRCLAGLLAADAGTIDLVEDGVPLDATARRHRVGYLAPDLAFYEPLTTLENLAFFGRLRRAEGERGRLLLERVGLPLDRAAGALSSGMLQRLRWCFALLHRPRALLLDEPFQNLDEPGRELTSALLAEHLDGGGLAVVANPGRLDVPRVSGRLVLGGG